MIEDHQEGEAGSSHKTPVSDGDETSGVCYHITDSIPRTHDKNSHFWSASYQHVGKNECRQNNADIVCFRLVRVGIV